MEFKIHQKIGARFKCVVRKAADNSIARESGWFLNKVLDSGLARMSVGTWIDRCCVGTGSSTPENGQTALDSFVASTTTILSSTNGVQTAEAPYYYFAKVTWRFGEGVAAGNIAEVGLGWGNSTLWNRALIKDASGNPAVITVFSDEYLDVVSEIRVYPGQALEGSFNLLDKLGNVKSTHTYTGLPYLYAVSAQFVKVSLGVRKGYLVWDGPIGTITSIPSGGRYSHESVALTYPTPTSCKAVFTLGLNDAVTIHKSFYLSVGMLLGGNADLNMPGYQLQISPPITKTATERMTYTFELDWGRYS
jgi:hypothetical protein